MNDQPEALRLADALVLRHGVESFEGDAASELRRLHAENEDLRRTLAASCDEERNQLWEAGPGGGCARALSAEFRCAELLEAIKEMIEAEQSEGKATDGFIPKAATREHQCRVLLAWQAVHAAIARAEGEPK